MSKSIKTFILIFCCITVLVGLDQIVYKNSIFADTLWRCCDQSYCNGESCTTGTSIKIKSANCLDIDGFSCKDCMDIISQGQNCTLPSSTYEYCTLANGHRYSTLYGEEFPHPTLDINGPGYLRYGTYGTFTAQVTNGYTPYHYQWYYEYPGNQSAAASSVSPHVLPVGVWYPIGSDNASLTTTFVQSVQLKCVVTDSRSETATDIIGVSIGFSKINANLGISAQMENELNYNITQNFPNPFNPTTVINYQLPEAGFVSIKVFDALGKEVQTLVNGYKDKGNYNIIFNGAKQNSGIYFYKIVTNKFSVTKKMLLIK